MYSSDRENVKGTDLQRTSLPFIGTRSHAVHGHSGSMLRLFRHPLTEIVRLGEV